MQVAKKMFYGWLIGGAFASNSSGKIGLVGYLMPLLSMKLTRQDYFGVRNRCWCTVIM